MTDFILPDDHIETPVLRQYAPGARCLVMGSYKGATMLYLFEHGASYVHGIEPQSWAYAKSVELLKAKGPYNWELDNVALVPWEVSTDFPSRPIKFLQYGTDGAKLDWTTPPHLGEMVAHTVVNVQDMLRDNGNGEERHYDFAVINCEGAEYMLFPYLAPHCDVMLIQFHGPAQAPMPIWPFFGENGQRTFIGKGWYLYA